MPEVAHGNALPCGFRSRAGKKHPGCSLSRAPLHILLMILLLKIFPKHIAEVLASIPKCKKVVRCIMEKKIHI